MSPQKKICCCILFGFLSLTTFAQKTKVPNVVLVGDSLLSKDTTHKLVVRNIMIRGAHQTKIYIIQREMPFKQGDSISTSKLHASLELARQQVYNTTLFYETDVIGIISDSNDINVQVNLKERWYIYPVPQFQLVDRNFNVWAKTYHYSFDRVNYGVKFVHYNLTGRKDPLRIYLLNGYSRNISFSYTAPYSNANLTEGFTVGGGYTQNREIAYKTSYTNGQLFYPVDSSTKARSEFVRSSWYVNGGYIIRRGLFVRHIFAAGYIQLKVADSVITKYNPNYFGTPTSNKGYPDIMYTYQYTNVDNVLYALKGTAYYFSILKRGLGWRGGMNMLSLEGGINKYYPLKKNWNFSFQANGKIKLPFEQSYINQRGLGYNENYLRGLEYYVIDGVATGLLRTTLKKKLFSFNIPVPFKFLHRIATNVPFTFFAKTYADAGYAYSQKQYDSRLNNRLLYSGGFGLDVLTLYDVNIRFEYSFNQLNERGMFFHTQSGF